MSHFSTTTGTRPKSPVWVLLIAFGQEAAHSAESLIFKNFGLPGWDTRYAGGIKAERFISMWTTTCSVQLEDVPL